MKIDVAARLKQLIELRGGGHETWSRKAGLSQRTVSHIINGRTNRPSAYTIDKLATALGVSADVVLGSQPIPPEFLASATQDPPDVAEMDDLKRVLLLLEVLREGQRDLIEIARGIETSLKQRGIERKAAGEPKVKGRRTAR